jgi:hypothetical protein
MTRGRRGARWAAAATAVVAMAVSATLVWNASYAAFSASTGNGGNSWSAGSVAIGNDQSGSAVFSLSGLKPDAATSTLSPPPTGAFAGSAATTGGSACIKVTYTGTLPADVRVHAALVNAGADGGLGQYLLFAVDVGTDASAGADLACATFTTGSYVYGSAANTNVFLSGMPTTAAGYAGGLTGWTGATQNSSVWYRLSWLLPADTPNAAQLESTTATFTWEAQNT